jgi:hypothetical protein
VLPVVALLAGALLAGALLVVALPDDAERSLERSSCVAATLLMDVTDEHPDRSAEPCALTPAAPRGVLRPAEAPAAGALDIDDSRQVMRTLSPLCRVWRTAAVLASTDSVRESCDWLVAAAADGFTVSVSEPSSAETTSAVSALPDALAPAEAEAEADGMSELGEEGADDADDDADGEDELEVWPVADMLPLDGVDARLLSLELDDRLLVRALALVLLMAVTSEQRLREEAPVVRVDA